MASISLKGTPANTVGDLPKKGSKAPNFALTATDLSSKSLADYAGKNVVLNIFPSIDTATCASSVHMFNKKASDLANTEVLCISADLPFAHSRFCGAEGIENVATLSSFKNPEFGTEFGTHMVDGPLQGLHARAIVVINPEGVVTHTELVPDIVDEPNYDAALAAIA